MDMVRYLRIAIDRLALPDKAVAIELDIDAKYLSKVFYGDKPFPYRRTSMLSLEVRQEMCRAWADELGLVVGSRAAVLKLAEGVLELARSEAQEAQRAGDIASRSIEHRPTFHNVKIVKREQRA